VHEARASDAGSGPRILSARAFGFCHSTLVAPVIAAFPHRSDESDLRIRGLRAKTTGGLFGTGRYPVRLRARRRARLGVARGFNSKTRTILEGVAQSLGRRRSATEYHVSNSSAWVRLSNSPRQPVSVDDAEDVWQQETTNQKWPGWTECYFQ